jgi:hypothetical protein
MDEFIKTGWQAFDKLSTGYLVNISSGIMVGESTIGTPHVMFGSEDSLDYDIMVFVDVIPSIQECKEKRASHKSVTT